MGMWLWRLPDLAVLGEGGDGGAAGRVGLGQAGGDLHHVGLRRLRDHHGVVERGRQRALRRLQLMRRALRLQPGEEEKESTGHDPTGSTRTISNFT